MDDVELMRRAMALATAVRSTTAPNPWVGCVVVPPGTPWRRRHRRPRLRRRHGAARRPPRRGGSAGRRR